MIHRDTMRSEWVSAVSVVLARPYLAYLCSSAPETEVASLKFRGSYSRYRTYPHADNADAIREVLQSVEIHVARHHQVPQIRKIPTSSHQCGPQMIANAPVRSLTPPLANTGVHHRAVSYVSPVMNPDIGQHGRASSLAVRPDSRYQVTLRRSKPSASREGQSPARQPETQPHRGNHLSTTFPVRSGARASIPCSIGWYDITYIAYDTYNTHEYAPI